MIESAVVLLGDDWKRAAMFRAGGLTLLGRALLALADAGITRVAIVGGDAALVARSLDGRLLRAEVFHFPQSAAVGREIADTLGIAPASLVAVVARPMLVGPSAALAIAPLDSLGGMEPSVGVAVPLGDADRERFERRLFDDIRKPMADDGAVAFHLLRPISTRLTRRLWHSRLTPNQISAMAIVVGVAAGPVAAQGGYLAGVSATLLLLANVVFDCVDGEIARLTHRKSRLGEWLDTVGDDASLLSYTMGLGWSVSWLPFGVDPMRCAIGAAALFAVTSAYVYYVLVREVGVVDTAQFPHLFSGRRAGAPSWLDRAVSLMTYTFKRDGFISIFVAAALLRLEWVSLALIALGAVVNAVAVSATALHSQAARVAPEQSR